MTIPTWQELVDNHCSSRWLPPDDRNGRDLNPFYEEMASRRYNYASSKDASACRLVFLKDVLEDSVNKTLVRRGRFVWCRNLHYEGRDCEDGLRYVSFTVDKGKKRFCIAEKNLLCLPSNSYVNNNRFLQQKENTFKAFSTVFGYSNTIAMMCKSSPVHSNRESFLQTLQEDNPYKPGTLVSARQGYFYPAAITHPEDLLKPHPYGIIIGAAFNNNDYSGREFYRVRFGDTTYERVHPIEMEIVNEV